MLKSSFLAITPQNELMTGRRKERKEEPGVGFRIKWSWKKTFLLVVLTKIETIMNFLL